MCAALLDRRYAERTLGDILAKPRCLRNFGGLAGSPTVLLRSASQARAKAIYAEDMGLALRKSHENPHVLKLYSEFLTDGPCGEVSHKYLHTHYTPRGDYLV